MAGCVLLVSCDTLFVQLVDFCCVDVDYYYHMLPD